MNQQENSSIAAADICDNCENHKPYNALMVHNNITGKNVLCNQGTKEEILLDI